MSQWTTVVGVACSNSKCLMCSLYVVLWLFEMDCLSLSITCYKCMEHVM